MQMQFLVAIALTLPCSEAQDAAGEDSWVGRQVAPKSRDFHLRVGSETAQGERHRIPFKVREQNGDWLWIGERVKGWVRKSDVVRLDDAPA